MAAPGQMPLRQVTDSAGARAAAYLHQPHLRGRPLGERRRAAAPAMATVADSPTRRAPGASRASRARPSASWSPRLAAGQRVDLVHHHRAEPGEERGASGWDSSSSRLSGVVSSMFGGFSLLPGAAVRRGVAGAGLDPDRQAHLIHRGHQVAGDIDRQRLQRRDYSVCSPGRGAAGQLDQARQEAGQGLAAAGRRDQQRRLAGLGRAPAARAGAAAASSRARRTRRQKVPAMFPCGANMPGREPAGKAPRALALQRPGPIAAGRAAAAPRCSAAAPA